MSENTTHVVATYDSERGEIRLPIMPVLAAAGMLADDDIEIVFDDDGTLVIRHHPLSPKA